VIDKLLQHHAVHELRPGQVAEFHLVSDSVRPGFIHTQSVDDFLEDWDYALLDRRWNETVYADELPEVNRNAEYIGVVHPDGAFLVELTESCA
jgi:hypothetical protein